MATDFTIIEPTLSKFPYVGLPDPALSRSVIPRAELVFYTVGEFTIPATGAGDDRQAEIQCQLPANFTYVLVEANARIYSSNNGAAPSVDENAYFIASEPNRPFFFSGCASACVIPPIQTGRGNYIWEFLGSKQIFDQNSLFRWYFNDTDTQKPALRGTFYAKFLQFDVNQKFHHEVNTPVLTR